MDRSKRTPVIAGNWKMNKSRTGTKLLIRELAPLVSNARCNVAVCVPFTDLDAAMDAARGSNIIVGAQNCHWADNGAFTGEVSASMLTETGISLCVVGHSERRQYFGETDETVNKRARAVIAAGLTAIVCVGETLEEREAGKLNEVIERQMNVGLKDVTAADCAKLVIAYEPVWAIGTGKTATPDQAQEVHALIRATLAKLVGAETAETVRIQYGGSMKPGNAAELLAKKDIDGGLIGGAALKAADFAGIIAAAAQA
jgi:triosephosphate isomerase